MAFIVLVDLSARFAAPINLTFFQVIYLVILLPMLIVFLNETSRLRFNDAIRDLTKMVGNLCTNVRLTINRWHHRTLREFRRS